MQAFSRGLFKELPALPTGRVDIVPVDYVADALVHLLDRREAGVFNLVAGRDASTVDELTTLASEYFGGRAPPFVEPVDPTRRRPTTTTPSTCRTSTCASCSTTPAPAPCSCRAGIEAPPLRDYFARLMDYAEAARWGKKRMTRETARARRAEPAAT